MLSLSLETAERSRSGRSYYYSPAASLRDAHSVHVVRNRSYQTSIARQSPLPGSTAAGSTRCPPSER